MSAIPQENLPDISKATLPQSYVAAKTALAECSRLDECQSWANKAEAMASYAKQANDDALRKMADRIQARAIRRCGELLKQIEPANGARTDKPRDGADPKLTRKQAATDAGLSERQRKTAIRVANIPADEFDQRVESENPPTITALADVGTKKSSHDFKRATAALGTLRRFSEFCEKNDPHEVASGVLDHEKREAKAWVGFIDSWMDRFITGLED